MPIVLAPPGPWDSAASQGAGAAQQFSRDLPSIEAGQRTLAGLYEAAARARQHSHGTGVDQRSSWVGGPSGGTVYDPHPYQPQQPDPLTQAESLRLQRLQNARSMIQDQVNQNQLSAEDGNQLLLQAQTGIDPLKQRQERAAAQMRETQAHEMMRQHALATSMENMSAADMAERFQSRMVPINDPRSGEFMGWAIPRGPGQEPFLVQPRGGGAQQSRLDPTSSRMLTDHLKMEVETFNQERADAMAAQKERHDRQSNELRDDETMPPDERRRRLRELGEQHRQEHHDLAAHYRGRQNAMLHNHRQVWVNAVSGQNPFAQQQSGGGGGSDWITDRALGTVSGVPGDGGGQPTGRNPAEVGRNAASIFVGEGHQARAVEAVRDTSDPGRIQQDRPDPWGGQSLAGVGATERPNEEAIPVEHVRRAGPSLVGAYNRLYGGRSRTMTMSGRRTAMETMADMLENANVRGRGLTRHELNVYRAMHRQLRQAGFSSSALGDSEL